MGYSSELKTSSTEYQNSKLLKEKVVSRQANRNLKYLDYSEVQKPFSQPYISRPHKQTACEGPVVQLTSPVNRKTQWLGNKTNKDDVLVKHMRNLPGYLQRMENGENFQEKALNFGVLDWGHLENWKPNEKRIPPRFNMKKSSFSSNPSCVGSGSATLSRTALRKNLVPQRKQPASNRCQLNSSYEERLSQGIPLSTGKVLQPQDSETAQRRTLGGDQNPCAKNSSSSSNYSEIKLDRSNRKHACQMATSYMETSSSDWRKYSSNDSMNDQGCAARTRLEGDINLAHEHFSSGHQSIILLLPGDSPRKSWSQGSQLSESRMSFEGNLTETNVWRFYDCLSPDAHPSVDPFSEVPHSCPLPVSVATNHEAECPKKIVIVPKGRSLGENKSVEEPSTPSSTSKRFYQGTAEQPTTKGRHPSPNRRFSFGLGKMARRLSFKESAAVPQLSSICTTVKSAPVMSDTSTGLDTFNGNKANASSRARSSPLRRLLDPLLKHKGAHATETVQPSKGNLNSMNFEAMKESDLLQGKKLESLSVRAILQLTMKNGVPFFKLVVDSSSEILAAAVKKLPASGKDDSSLIYAFYSVHEIKKKSGGWINQGSKGKNNGFGYNILGQMKVSSSYPSDLGGESRKAQYVVRESVLYSADIGLGDQRTADFMPSRELAAILVKNPSDEYGDEVENCKSTVVILPGGVHGLPNSGLPSPLINRWRSGGACDCGGWDVGCKLRILTDLDEMGQIPSPSIPCSRESLLDLCYQGGHPHKKIFSLTPLQNGLYSLEYDIAAVSLLQAFSICVAFVSSQNYLAHIFEVKTPFAPMAGNDGMKTSNTVRTEVPAKYVSSPPLSPVGRA